MTSASREGNRERRGGGAPLPPPHTRFFLSQLSLVPCFRAKNILHRCLARLLPYCSNIFHFKGLRTPVTSILMKINTNLK